MDKMSKTFCMHPFTGLATRQDGAIQACCRSHPVGWIQKETLEEIWNNESMREIRRQVLNGERPAACEPCFNLEDQGVESLRQRHINGVIPEARINLYPDALSKLGEDYTMPFEIPTMELKLNNLCNLKCRMCHPLDSTSWNDWKEVEEFYDKEKNFLSETIRELKIATKPYVDSFTNDPKFWNNLEKLLPYFRRVEFAGGEPLMDPTHYKILDMMAPYGENIEVKYATNLTVLGIKGGRNVWDYWPKFKSIAVNVSIDGFGDVYEYVRGNGKWNDVVANIREIQKMPNISRVVGAVTVQVANIMQLDQCCEKWLDELGIVFYTHRVAYPNLLSIQVLPPELKTIAIDRLESVKERLDTFKLVQQHPIIKKVAERQLQDNINYLKAKDQHHRWNDMLEFNRRLDKTRNQGPIESIIPEFKSYV